MRKLKVDFAKRSNTEEWYDLREDWSLVEASLATQYGIRIRQHTDMPWTEFCTLVSGLMPETPLGNVVQIRAEKDIKAVKAFSSDQKRIYNSWKNRQAQKQLSNPEKLDKDMEQLSNMIASMFGKG